ncbi:HlyD family efflux transporter periplasmic adaptor subunit [Pseudomonas aeruginosa]|uniref:HlyD family efflux transporter periplasmic adaptor subunit n=1 Tax=Pseudomonas aeruginosa TaxID=287 RepID=UPI000F7E1B2A|nr:HlyD family secretion protein [Pseudomonas aeruginosa]RTC31942.1 HlyD family secretion protein [Pseudomonas aeruginosa]
MNLLQGKWPRLATLLAVLVAAALVFLAWERYTRTPWTRDARVRADVVTLSADVSGLITRLPLSDNQPVEKGELLLSIDPARYELAALGESRAAIEASQAQLRQRRSEAQRRSALQKRSMLSVEENEKAQTDVSLAQAELLRNQASLGLAQANVELAEAALQQARLDLERTQVRAPVSGYVTNLQTREGDYAHAGVPLLALVDRDSFYVSGYFEETKLPGIHVGSRARVELMSGERFDGRVQSIAHAITDRENAEGSRLLANINPSYTWVKLAQRIPVRIAIDPAYRQRNTLRAGVTATIRVLPAEDTAKVDSAAPGTALRP